TLSPNPRWLIQSKIVRSDSGVRIAFIGLTAPFNPYYHLLGWHVEAIEKVIDRELRKLQEKTDVVVLLCHLGIDEDRTIAEKYQETDVIIRGHTHHLLRHGEVINETLLTAAGKHSAYVGEVRLNWDHERRKLIDKAAYTANIT